MSSQDQSALIAVLNQIARVLIKYTNAGQVYAQIDVINVAGSGTAQALYTISKPVRKAVIQNLSTTDNLTLTASTTVQGGVIAITAGVGIILNKATAAGQGGGTLSVDNVDLSSFTFIISDTGNKIAVFYEI